MRGQAEALRPDTDSATAAAVLWKSPLRTCSDVAVEGVLRLSRGLPLVAPHDVETGAIECEMEAPDPGKQLGDGRSATGLTTGLEVGIGHARPFVCGGGRVVSSVADPWHAIKLSPTFDSSDVLDEVDQPE